MEKYDYTYTGSEDYCYPGTSILKNKLGIKDDNALTIAEREITSLKLLLLYNKPIIENYNLNGLSQIHQIIFGDIYEWAGQIRRGEFLSKGSSIFCRGPYITENADKIFGNIKNENNLNGLTKAKFIERMAFYLGEVNALHPFREGNGRTSREFFRQLALNADYILDFSEIEKDELLMADIEAFNGKYENLIKILDKTIIGK
jgi:cell filamentation protein